MLFIAANLLLPNFFGSIRRCTGSAAKPAALEESLERGRASDSLGW